MALLVTGCEILLRGMQVDHESLVESEEHWGQDKRVRIAGVIWPNGQIGQVVHISVRGKQVTPSIVQKTPFPRSDRRPMPRCKA